MSKIPSPLKSLIIIVQTGEDLTKFLSEIHCHVSRAITLSDRRQILCIFAARYLKSMLNVSQYLTQTTTITMTTVEKQLTNKHYLLHQSIS